MSIALAPLVDLMKANDLEAAATEAMSLFSSLDRDDVRTRAWCLALYGVVESRFGHWDTALDILDEAAQLAREAEDEALRGRIAIDRLMPVAHQCRVELPHQIEEAKQIVGEEPQLAATLDAILLRLPDEETAAPARIVAKETLRLVSDNLPRVKELPLVGDALTLGRKRDCDLQIQCDAEISRVHCHLEVRRDGWHVLDVSSRGNTSVTGCMTPTGPLREGAIIELGATRFRVCA